MDVCMEKRNEPLLLRPAGKDYLWGGKRLNDEDVYKRQRQQMRHWNFMRLSQEGKILTDLYGLQLLSLIHISIQLWILMMTESVL